MHIEYTVLKPIQCNLDYQDFISLEPRLSRLAGDQQIHYYACTEGVANDICGCGDKMSSELDSAPDLPGLKLTDKCTFLDTAGHDHTMLLVGIFYRLGIINQVRNVGTSVIQTVSLIQYGSYQLLDKGVRIIEATPTFSMLQCSLL